MVYVEVDFDQFKQVVERQSLSHAVFHKMESDGSSILFTVVNGVLIVCRSKTPFDLGNPMKFSTTSGGSIPVTSAKIAKF